MRGDFLSENVGQSAVWHQQHDPIASLNDFDVGERFKSVGGSAIAARTVWVGAHQNAHATISQVLCMGGTLVAIAYNPHGYGLDEFGALVERLIAGKHKAILNAKCG